MHRHSNLRGADLLKIHGLKMRKRISGSDCLSKFHMRHKDTAPWITNMDLEGRVDQRTFAWQ